MRNEKNLYINVWVLLIIYIQNKKKKKNKKRNIIIIYTSELCICMYNVYMYRVIKKRKEK